MESLSAIELRRFRKNHSLLRTRIYDVCMYFYLFCNNTRFDAKPAIESIIAEYEQNITYKDVAQNSLKRLREGKNIKIIKTKKKATAQAVKWNADNNGYRH